MHGMEKVILFIIINKKAGTLAGTAFRTLVVREGLGKMNAILFVFIFPKLFTPNLNHGVLCI